MINSLFDIKTYYFTLDTSRVGKVDLDKITKILNYNGFVKITEAQSPHVGTNLGTTAVGSVSVTTT